jgi:hypothetical protein
MISMSPNHPSASSSNVYIDMAKIKFVQILKVIHYTMPWVIFAQPSNVQDY